MAEESVRVVAVDVGGVRRGNFGWWVMDVPDPARPGPGGEAGLEHAGRGQLPSEVVEVVTAALAARRKVALGLESPLFVPVPSDEQELGAARDGEAGPGRRPRPWSAGAGAGALATGAAQLAWLLSRIRERTPVPVTMRPERWEVERPLLLWEAFVTADAKVVARHDPEGSHVADARLAVEAFVELGAKLFERGEVYSRHPVFNLAAAAATTAGLAIGPAELAAEVRVVRVDERREIRSSRRRTALRVAHPQEDVEGPQNAHAMRQPR